MGQHSSTPTSDSFCSRCRALDLSAIVPTPTRHNHDFEQELCLWLDEANGVYGEPGCPLCGLFAYFGGPDQTNDPDGATTILICSSDNMFLNDPERNGTYATLFWRWYQNKYRVIGLLHRHNSKEILAPRILDLRCIDYAIIRVWLRECITMHDEACSTPTQGVLPGFKVIDCGTKSVIEAPEKCSYIALSYVWGGGQGSGQAHVEGIFPATIDDSIMVALALGFKYLWVDRYCIDQTSSSEKHAQISGMHKIYSEAALTIIAAAGKDPSYGLPGVGATPRAAQYRVQLGNKTLVEMFPHTNVTLQESEWVSRAWTYQEGFLSKRKLIFDDHQVSFVCGKVFCAESFTHSIEHRALNEELTFGPYFPYDIAFRGTDWKPEGIANCIEEYTERNLSYDSDGLNACLGILNFFNEERQVKGHLWGVLLLDVRELLFSESHIHMKLTWYHPRPARRRPGFPSWTWAGWAGPIRNDLAGPRLDDGHPSIHVMPFGHGWMPMLEYLQSGIVKAQAESPESPDAPRLLKLTGLCPNFRLVDRGPNGVQALIPIAKDVDNVLDVYLDEPDLQASDLADCIAITMDSRGRAYSGFPWECSFLLLKPIGDGSTYRRIGMFDLRYDCRLYAGIGESSRPPTPPLWFRNAEKRTLVVE